jgi:hypothetical protein
VKKEVYLTAVFFGVLLNAGFAAGACTAPAGSAAATRAALQALLNSKNDCVLCQKQVYQIDSTLVYRAPNQKIYTENATYLSEYATIRTTNRAVLCAIDGSSQDSVVLEKVIVDGNRYRIGANDKVDGEKPLVQFGVKSGQKIRNNIIMSTRSWSTLQSHEGGGTSTNILIENNLILGAGPDGRGNGLSTDESQTKKGHWGDCISLASRTTMVRNNFLFEPTDLGVAIFSAPGSIIENNVQASWSREALSSFDMVDGILIYESGIYDGKPAYPYPGTIIRNNYSDAYGSRICIGFALGQPIWQSNYVKVMTKGTVTGNTMSGGAYGYGIAIHGCVDFTVTGNVSKATHAGKGNGAGGKAPPDPAAFQCYSPRTWNCTLQPEFVKLNDATFINLLSVNAPPYIDNGNLIARVYTAPEAVAVVKAAYVEMLHRLPTAAEQTKDTAWLKTITYDISKRPRNLNTADMLRLKLVQLPEFKTKFNTTLPATKDAMQLHRLSEWQKALSEGIDAAIKSTGQFPSVKTVYLDIIDAWEGKVVGALPTGASAAERQFSFSVVGRGVLFSGRSADLHTVAIYSLNGGLLREIPVTAASRNIVWDGMDRFGRSIANGAYAITIRGPATSRTFKILASM